MLALKVSAYQRGDIFTLIGQSVTQLEIDDLARDSRHLSPRYTIMITPEWVQGLNTVGEFLTCQTLVASATLGDVCAARWWVYGTNGIPAVSFRVRLTAYDIRVLHHAYQLAGVPCSQDPYGQVSVMGAPHSIGRSVVITQSDGQRARSRHSHVPFPTMTVFRGKEAKWPLVSPDQRPISIGEKIVILGGYPTLGLESALDHVDSEPMMGPYYPRALARQSLREARCRFEAGHFRHFLSRAEGKKGAGTSAAAFPPNLLRRVYGDHRIMAIISGISPTTRSRYISGRNRRVIFPEGQQRSPWISRDNDNWDELLIGFILFAANVMGNACPKIRGKLPAIRFWRVVSGRADFSSGGGSFKQVMKSLRRKRKVNRKRPVTYDMLQWLYRDFWLSGPTSGARCGIMCAVLLGFFFLLRISEIEQCTWDNVTLGEDRDNDDIAALVPPKCKTDQFNDGDAEAWKTLANSLFHVEMVMKWLLMPRNQNNDKGRFPKPHLRTHVTCALRLAVAACGV